MRAAWIFLGLALGLPISKAPGRADADCADREPTGALLRLAPAGEPGERLVFVGRVMDARQRPVPGATVYLYHADTDGEYAPLGESEPRLCGVLRTDARGSFRVETVMPSRRRNREGGAPHIHGVVWGAGYGKTPFVVSLEARDGRFVDAAWRAGWGIRGRTQRPVYRDEAGTWWLIFNPKAG